jgi:hypothetical protein
MNKFHFFSFLAFVFFSCSSTETKNKLPVITNPGVAKTRSRTADSSAPHKKTTAELRKEIYGRWGAVGDTVSNFAIEGKDIFYYDSESFCKYNLSNDTLSIFDDDGKFCYKVKMKGKDTLVMIGTGKSGNDTDSFFRCAH